MRRNEHPEKVLGNTLQSRWHVSPWMLSIQHRGLAKARGVEIVETKFSFFLLKLYNKETKPMHNLWAPQDSFKLCSPHIHEKLLNISLSCFMMMVVPLKHTQTHAHRDTHMHTCTHIYFWDDYWVREVCLPLSHEKHSFVKQTHQWAGKHKGIC